MSTKITVVADALPMLDWSDLTDEEKKNFPECVEVDDSEYAFIRHDNSVYGLEMFLYIPVANEALKGWDGKLKETVDSGMLVLFLDNDMVKLGRYYSSAD